MLGGIHSTREGLGIPALRDTPPPASPNPKAWTRTYRDKWVRPRVHAGLEEPWWSDHAGKPKHAAFLTRAGAPGMWLAILLHTAEHGVR